MTGDRLPTGEPIRLGGMRMFFDANMMCERRRSIVERLFSRPWRPWVRMKSVPSQAYTIVPSVTGVTLVCHPSMEPHFNDLLRRSQYAKR